MRSIKTLVAAFAVAMLLSTGAFAGADLNEVGALLVYPTIVATPGVNPTADDSLGGVETFVTITNAGPDDVVLHVSYINGQAYYGNHLQNSEKCDDDITSPRVAGKQFLKC